MIAFPFLLFLKLNLSELMMQTFKYLLNQMGIYVEELLTYSFDGSYEGTNRLVSDNIENEVIYFYSYEALMDTALEMSEIF